MSDELHGLDDYLTRADDDIPSGDGRKVKPLMLTCQTCGWRGPVSDAARPCIDAGHKLIGRNGQVQQFSESWRTKTLSTTPKPVRCASCDDDCTGAVYQYVAGEPVCCDACARAVLASLEE